jgi:hypothetical protein
MPPTGLRGAIFGARALEAPDSKRTPVQPIPAQRALAETTRPPVAPVAAPDDDGPPGAKPQPTRQVNWEDYGKLVNPERVQTVPRLEAQKDAPPPSKTVHDDLLAAFLADEPLPPDPDPSKPPGDGGGS